METNLWKQKRKRQQYQQLKEQLDDGINALVLLHTKQSEIDITIDDDKVDDQLTTCEQCITELLHVFNQSHTEPLTHLTIIEETNITQSQLETVQQTLKDARDYRGLTNYHTSKEILQTLEQFAKRKTSKRTF